METPMLEELLEQVTDENRHPEVDTGAPVGKEKWWDDSTSQPSNYPTTQPPSKFSQISPPTHPRAIFGK